MCGVFGLSFKEKSQFCSEGQRALLIYMLAELNDTRGGKAWGFAAEDKGGKVVVKKGLKTMAPEVMQLIPYANFLAHTRYPTRGADNVNNAHPFTMGKVIGAHNGQVFNWWDLDKKYESFDVDSQHLFNLINLGKNFDEVRGYGTIEWMENNVPLVHLCKMEGGQLSVYGIGDYDENKIDGVVWSSDEKHLEAALEFAGIENYFAYTLQRDQVYLATKNGLLFAVDSTGAHRKYKLGESNSNFQNNWKHGYGWGGGEDDSYPNITAHNYKNHSSIVNEKKEDISTDKLDVANAESWDWKHWNEYLSGDDEDGEKLKALVNRHFSSNEDEKVVQVA